MWYACGLAQFYSSISQNNIVDFIDDFWQPQLDILNEVYHMQMYDHV